MSPGIREGLIEKVSYERMGIEIDKMLEGNKAHKSIAVLHQLNLLSILYKFPNDLIYF